MTGRCETCPHWQREQTEFADWEPRHYLGPGPSKHGGPEANYNSVPLRDIHGDWGECRVAASSDAQPVLTDTMAFAQDSEGCRAFLSTHRLFGCVMHPDNGGDKLPPPDRSGDGH